MEDSKTHYRRVFKSDHLGIADLEDLAEQNKKLIFTIKETKQYLLDPNDKKSGVVVAGKRISANVAFFKEDIKPMVLNATNSAIVKGFANGSPFVEAWSNITIELYIDRNVSMKGEVVGGVRIRPVQPVITKPVLTAEHKNFAAAKQAFKDGKGQAVLDRYQVSDSVLDLLKA